jgi:hypothetical protein
MTMKPIPFRTIFIILGIISILCLLSPAAIGLLSAASNYEGNCYGFTDGSAPCSWWDFARNEMSYGFIIAFTPAIFLIAGWLTALGIWLALRLQPDKKTLPLWQIIFIPLLACIFLACLLYILPTLAGLRR